ncbi:hypothetical protein HOP53_06195 [Halomonas sp. MCCC 1A11081]|uniref:Serine kinase n=2 Tax=Billgrantia ethanolica TaxID=2733486 RepID=A0ABS9A3N7_9GAMM|nr:hypothetical protein [Halomonas ethanolica]
METTHRFRFPLSAAPATAECDLTFHCELKRAWPTPSRQNALYLSPSRNRFEEPDLEIYAVAGGNLMRFPRVAEFLVAPGRIDCRLQDGEAGFMVDLYLLGDVLSYYLEMTGISALHAGAVAHKGRAMLFAADRTGGKSTLVTYLVAAGFHLLADDIAALEPDDAWVTCRHAFPQLKLTPEQARRFVGTSEGFEPVHPSFPKLSVPAERVGHVSRESLPVARIYLLERRVVTGGDTAIRLEPLGPGEALIQLVRHSFLAEVLEGCGYATGQDGTAQADIARTRFHRLAAIARSVVVKRLCYPSGYHYLPAVHRAVLADLGEAQGVERQQAS